MADAKSSAFRDWVVVVVTVVELFYKVNGPPPSVPQNMYSTPIEIMAPCTAPDWTEEECEYPDPCACEGQ